MKICHIITGLAVGGTAQKNRQPSFALRKRKILEKDNWKTVFGKTE